MTFNFAMQAMDQIINSAAKTLYMSGGQMGCADRLPRPERRGRARRGPAQPGLFGLVLAVPGPQGGRAVYRRRRQGLLKAAIRDPNPVIFLENEMLYGHRSPVPKLDDYVLPIGKARIARAGKRRHDGRLVDRHDLCAEGRRRTRQGGHRGRGHRPAHAAPDGHRNHRDFGARRPAAP